jgi:predicted O-methyltransferase YrrM
MANSRGGVDVNVNTILENYQRINLSDREIIGPILQERDAKEDYLSGNRTYAWHVAIGAAVRPEEIGEIGVRFGYSLYSLARGARTSSGVSPQLWGWDAECYVPGSIAIAKAALGDHANLCPVNTQNLTALSCPPLDLFHVDGDHSFAGCSHDMALAWAVLRPGGVMLVDDVSFIGDCRDAVSRFAASNKITYAVLPTFRGTALFVKEDGS